MQIDQRVINDAERRAHRESLRERVYKKTPGVCWYCGDSIHHKGRTLDHVKPRARGGGDTFENLVPCCKDCNRMKGDGPLSTLRRRLRWRMSGRPEFSPEQVAWLEREYGLSVDPGKEVKFWFEIHEKG